MLNSENNIGYFDYKTQDFNFTEFEIKEDASIYETRKNFSITKNQIYQIDKFQNKESDDVDIYTIDGEFYVRHNRKFYLVCKYFDCKSPIVIIYNRLKINLISFL